MENEIRNQLINNFLRISKVPRESGHEEKIADFFVNVAKKNLLYYFKDENNNVLIKKKGNNSTNPIALQAHLDMVCVKRKESHHNFLEDGVEVIIDGDKVTAKDTSLGADQGVGLAMMLTLLEDKNINHPDLEFLFTTEEETTFNGAVTFPYSQVDSKRLINLDNSKDDVIFIASDGDRCNEYCFKGNFIENKVPSYKVLIEGFSGGNSSEDIHLSENNAITTMARLLKKKDIFIRSINGGMSENDLATSCEVIMHTNLDVEEMFKNVNATIQKVDSQLSFSRDDTNKIINEILDLKCGYITESLASANLGMIHTHENEIKIYYVFRSMNENELEMIHSKSKSLGNDFIVHKLYSDPIWNINPESELRKKYKEVYFKKYLRHPKEEIFHGAIECAPIKKRINELDIISIGSNIEKYHTVDEVTYISSWLKVYELLVQLLKKLVDHE